MMTVSSSTTTATATPLMGMYNMDHDRGQQEASHPQQSVGAISASKPTHERPYTTAATMSSADDSWGHPQRPSSSLPRPQRPKRHSSLQEALNRERQDEPQGTLQQLQNTPSADSQRHLEHAKLLVTVERMGEEPQKQNKQDENPGPAEDDEPRQADLPLKEHLLAFCVEEELAGQQVSLVRENRPVNYDSLQSNNPEKEEQTVHKELSPPTQEECPLQLPATPEADEQAALDSNPLQDEQPMELTESREKEEHSLQEDIHSELSEHTDLQDSFLTQSVHEPEHELELHEQNMHAETTQEKKGQLENFDHEHPQPVAVSPQNPIQPLPLQSTAELDGQVSFDEKQATGIPFATAVPLLISQMETLQAIVQSQQKVIQANQESIQMLQKTLEEQHASTQNMLQGILQAVSSMAAGTNVGGDGKDEAQSMEQEVARRKTLMRPAFMTDPSSRSVDAEFRPPQHRHDSMRHLQRDEIPTSEQQQRHNPPPEQNELPGDGGHHSLDHVEITIPQQQLLLRNQPCEIELDGSHHSFDRNDLPNMDVIFARCYKDQPKETDSPAQKPPTRPDRKASSHVRSSIISNSASQHSKPLEIILEGSGGDCQRLRLPAGPEELFASSPPAKTPEARTSVNNSKSSMRWHDSISDNNEAQTDANVVPAATSSRPNLTGNGMPRDGCDIMTDEVMAKMQLSAVTLDSAIFDNNNDGRKRKTQSNKGEVDGTDENCETDEFDDKFEPEDLQTVRAYSITDMYGDRGTFTGTLDLIGAPSGFGSMKYESGRFYKGEWKDGRWNGKGTLLNSNGDSYQGDFLDDARHGEGVYRFTSGDIYEGEFLDDNRHGKGVFKFHNGSVYAGEFYMGSFEGQGRYDFDGGFYEGGWRRDEYYGGGRLEYKDGSRYAGNFKRGAAHGFGEETLADGTVRRGLWKKGEFIEECSAVDASGNLSFATNKSRGSRRNNSSNDSLVKRSNENNGSAYR